MRSLLPALAVPLLLLLPLAEVTAGPTDAVVVAPAPAGRGAISVPAGRPVAELEQAYLEEEFFVSGAATVYTYAETPVPGETVVLAPDVPYTTRILVRRPADPAAFHGTLVIEWLNSTAGYDTAPVWHASAEYFARKGIVYVGVTNSIDSIDFLVDGCPLLGLVPPPLCGTRYRDLSLPRDGAVYEMMSQIAHLLKSASAENPLFPDYPVERLFHAGQSRQGGSVVTYATAFHFPVNDGYFVQAAGSARPINFQCPCEETDPGVCIPEPYPACTPTLEGADQRVATDLPVPVVRVHTETDLAAGVAGDTRQTDTPTFRYYETAGTAHVTIHADIESLPAGVLGLEDPIFLEELCASEPNTLADGPVFGSYLYNALWENLERQVRFGIPPPQGPLLRLDAERQIDRDEFGNARGGIRLPQLDLPTASYAPTNRPDPGLEPIFVPLAAPFCALSGSVDRFDAATLAARYPDRTEFVRGFNERIDALVAARFLLPEDAAKLRLAVQDRDQRKCIDGLGKNLARVARAQAGELSACLQDGSRGRLDGQGVEACATADTKGRLAKAQQKTTRRAQADCTVTPDFGARDPDVVHRAAVGLGLDLFHDLFGPDLDAAIRGAASDAAGARCQLETAKQVTKCEQVVLDEFARCASSGLRQASIHDARTLEACMAHDPKGRIARACSDRLRGGLERRCSGLDHAALFPGVCGGEEDRAELAICIAQRVECRACLALNQAHDLDRNCDRLDDGLFNASCPRL